MPSARAYAASAGAVACGALLAGCDAIVGFGDLPPSAAPPLAEACFAGGLRPVEPKTELVLRVPFTENGGVAVSGPLEVKACEVFDPTCESPLSFGVTDAAGVAELIVPAAPPAGEFLGFLRVDRPGYFRGSTFFRPPPRVDATLPAAIAVTDQVVTLLTMVLGIDRATLDERAHLAVLPVTCGRQPVAGIEPVLPPELDLTDSSTVTLVRNAGNLLPGQNVTAADGIVVFANLRLPEGQDSWPITLSLIDQATRAEFVPPQLVPLRRGEVTTLVVAPEP
ncbi:MAG TPA: hypothetical protein VFS43_14580 [Polyangiaceae bacterium]|nr:hypothetical protein [Polyangiaceae bacterium]